MAGGNFGHHDERIRKVGKGKWQSVFANLQHAIHVQRRYPQEALWMPVRMVYHFIWKRTFENKIKYARLRISVDNLAYLGVCEFYI